MVRVGSSFVNGSSQPLEPVAQFAGERDRHVRRPERRRHLEARLLQISDAVEAEDREPSKRTGSEIVDICVALGVHGREPPTTPVGETATEPHGLHRGVIRHELLAAHHDHRIDRDRRPPDARKALGHNADRSTQL